MTVSIAPWASQHQSPPRARKAKSAHNVVVEAPPFQNTSLCFPITSNGVPTGQVFCPDANNDGQSIGPVDAIITINYNNSLSNIVRRTD